MTILRLQRDEFLPLRVIRDELADPGAAERKPPPSGSARRADRADRARRARAPVGRHPQLLKELEDYGLLAPVGTGGDKRYPESDVDVAAVCAQLARFGIDGRHLRTFRTAADREAALLEQLSPRRCARATTSGGRQGSRDLQSADRAGAGADGAAPVARGAGHGRTVTAVDLRSTYPRGRRLPDPGCRVQGHHAAARRSGRSEADDRGSVGVGGEKDADVVLGAEARGFILGAAVAAEAGVGFVPARRPGKLPPETVGATYLLEYGENVLEVHPDLIPPGARVVIHDDVLATGGTVEAICGLVRAARRRGRRGLLHHRADVPGRP